MGNSKIKNSSKQALMDLVLSGCEDNILGLLHNKMYGEVC